MEPEQVRKVAALARLKLTDDEVADCGTQLTEILDYVRLLDEVDITGVEPMPHAIELQNVLRDDERRDSLPTSDALGNAPQTDGHCFLVPRILEDKGPAPRR